jgi:hypothetical protein
LSAAASAIVARCLLDPAFLARLTANRAAALEGCALDDKSYTDFAQLDLQKVRSFGGFITKVQHNYLWDSFPYVRTLMKLYGIEIEVFAGYRQQHLQLVAARASRVERISTFLAYLRSYLGAEDGSRWLGLRDMVEHERMEWEIRGLLTDPSLRVTAPTGIDTSALGWPVLESLVPAPSIVRCSHFTYDPRSIVAELASGRFPSDELMQAPRWLAYCADGAGRVRVLELDDVSVILLSEVDGRRTIGSIVDRVRQQLSPLARPSELRAFFDAGFRAGLLLLADQDGAVR